MRRAGPALLLALLAPVAGTGVLRAQSVAWSVDARSSLAWWQIDPHYNHLWATTCPDDPSWQPGEGRSPGYYAEYLRRVHTSDAGISDSRVPLYPRRSVRPLCRPAVSGSVTLEDSADLSSARGEITVVADSLVTGLDMRDAFARKAVFQTRAHPHIRFTIDSLTEVQPGDTTRAVAVGSFELHGVSTPMEADVVLSDLPGGLRVRARFSVPARQLTRLFDMSAAALGMG
ncbi:MAG: YceI family protein, partial [Longimicrobiales bacterium]